MTRHWALVSGHLYLATVTTVRLRLGLTMFMAHSLFRHWPLRPVATILVFAWVDYIAVYDSHSYLTLTPFLLVPYEMSRIHFVVFLAFRTRPRVTSQRWPENVQSELTFGFQPDWSGHRRTAPESFQTPPEAGGYWKTC